MVSVVLLVLQGLLLYEAVAASVDTFTTCLRKAKDAMKRFRAWPAQDNPMDRFVVHRLVEHPKQWMKLLQVWVVVHGMVHMASASGIELAPKRVSVHYMTVQCIKTWCSL